MGDFIHYTLKPFSWMYIILYASNINAYSELTVRGRYTWDSLTQKYGDVIVSDEEQDIYEVGLSELGFELSEQLGVSETAREKSA